MLNDDLDRVTPALLRRAEEMCPRRLHHEHNSRAKPSPLGDAPFEVANRLTQDAITWHKGGDPAVPGFPEPADLEPEQRAVYRAAARAYTARFSEFPLEMHDLEWSTDFPELAVQLVSSPGIAVVAADGRRELRLLRLHAGDARIDDVELRCLLLRASEWAPDGFRIVVVDLLGDNTVEYEIDVTERLDETIEWLRERVEAVRARADRFRAITGADCRTCQCIPGCPKVTAAP
jgi:hypothetical protein